MSEQPNRAERRRLDVQFKKCHRREEKKKMKATTNAHQYNAKKSCKLVPHLESKKKDEHDGEQVKQVVSKRVNVASGSSPKFSNDEIKRFYAASLGDHVNALFRENHLIAKTVCDTVNSWSTAEDSIPLTTLGLAHTIDEFATGLIGAAVNKVLIDTNFGAKNVMGMIMGLLYNSFGYMIREISGKGDVALSDLSWNLEKLFAKALKQAIKNFFNECLNKEPLHTDSADTLFFDEFCDAFFDVYNEKYYDPYHGVNRQGGGYYTGRYNQQGAYIEELEDEFDYEDGDSYEDEIKYEEDGDSYKDEVGYDTDADSEEKSGHMEENDLEEDMDYENDAIQEEFESSGDSKNGNQNISSAEEHGNPNNNISDKVDNQYASDPRDVAIEDKNGSNDAADCRSLGENDTTDIISNESVKSNEVDRSKSHEVEKSNSAGEPDKNLMHEYGDKVGLCDEDVAAVAGEILDAGLKSDIGDEPMTEATGDHVIGVDENHDIPSDTIDIKEGKNYVQGKTKLDDKEPAIKEAVDQLIGVDKNCYSPIDTTDVKEEKCHVQEKNKVDDDKKEVGFDQNSESGNRLMAHWDHGAEGSTEDYAAIVDELQCMGISIRESELIDQMEMQLNKL